MPRKHHTKRLLVARRKAIKEWEQSLLKRNLPEPTDEQYVAFVTAYNMGYVNGYKHALNPKKQQSKWKPVLDALCRFKDPISFEQALKLLGCTEKALQKHLDNYDYIPTYKDYCYMRKYDVLDDLDILRF